jgi:DNA-binding NarL/FixJ family response regulator
MSGISRMACGPGRWENPYVRPSLLIVDDHAGFRRLARRLLQAEGFDVIGEARDGASALTAAEQLHPGVVLLDVLLPDMDGFEVARRLAEGARPPRVVLTSSRDAADFGDRVRESPVMGFVHKGNLSGAELARVAGIAR